MDIKKTLAIILLVASNASFGVFTVDSRSTFIYKKNDDLPIRVNINGCTDISNLIQKSIACMTSSSDRVPVDQEQSIEVVFVKAIEIYNANHEKYNGLTAFIIQTADGKFLLHFQIVNYIALAQGNPLRHLMAHLQCQGVHSTMEVSSASALVYDFGSDASAQSFASAFGTDTFDRYHYSWATIQVDESIMGTESVNIPLSDTLSISFNYSVLEQSRYSDMPRNE